MTMRTFKSFAALAPLFCLLIGIPASSAQTPAASTQTPVDSTQIPAYKKAFLAAIEAAKAKDYSTARDEFARTAELAMEEEDAEFAARAAGNAAKIDHNIGKGLVEQKDYEGALERFNAGIAMLPSYVKNYEGKALALKKLERNDEAIQVYEDMVAFGNEHDDSRAVRNGEAGIRGQFNGLASSALRRRSEPSATDAREAIAHLEALQERVDPDANTYYYLAVANNTLGNYEEAVALADQALEIHRGSRTDAAKIHFARGEAFMYAGNITAAKESFENARYGEYKDSAEHYLETL